MFCFGEMRVDLVTGLGRFGAKTCKNETDIKLVNHLENYSGCCGPFTMRTAFSQVAV